jgi:hypothetical protein
VVLLMEGDLVSCSLAMNEHVGHEDLCGSVHQSVIPYIHGKTGVVLLKTALPEPAFFPTLRRGAWPSLL